MRKTRVALKNETLDSSLCIPQSLIRTRAFPRHCISIIERLQKSDDVCDFLSAQRWRLSRLAAERWLRVDVSAVLFGQVVELAYGTVLVAWIPPGWIRIACRVELQYLFQRVEYAVVEEHLAHGDVA